MFKKFLVLIITILAINTANAGSMAVVNVQEILDNSLVSFCLLLVASQIVLSIIISFFIWFFILFTNLSKQLLLNVVCETI